MLGMLAVGFLTFWKWHRVWEMGDWSVSRPPATEVNWRAVTPLPVSLVAKERWEIHQSASTASTPLPPFLPIDQSGGRSPSSLRSVSFDSLPVDGGRHVGPVLRSVRLHIIMIFLALVVDSGFTCTLPWIMLIRQISFAYVLKLDNECCVVFAVLLPALPSCVCKWERPANWFR